MNNTPFSLFFFFNDTMRLYRFQKIHTYTIYMYTYCNDNAVFRRIIDTELPFPRCSAHLYCNVEGVYLTIQDEI